MRLVLLLHFSNLKNPQQAANNVLLRLLRDGQIQRSTSFVPYVYFGAESQIKKNSQKINHFLAILNTYKEIRQHGTIETFLVEPKYGKKGVAEPDAFLKFRSTGFLRLEKWSSAILFRSITLNLFRSLMMALSLSVSIKKHILLG